MSEPMLLRKQGFIPDNPSNERGHAWKRLHVHEDPAAQARVWPVKVKVLRKGNDERPRS